MNHLNPAMAKAAKMTKQKRDLSMLAGKRGRERQGQRIRQLSSTYEVHWQKLCSVQLGVLFDCTEKSRTGIMTLRGQYRPHKTSVSEWLFIKGIATQRQKKDKGVRPRRIFNSFSFYSLNHIFYFQTKYTKRNKMGPCVCLWNLKLIRYGSRLLPGLCCRC